MKIHVSNVLPLHDLTNPTPFLFAALHCQRKFDCFCSDPAGLKLKLIHLLTQLKQKLPTVRQNRSKIKCAATIVKSQPQ